MGQFPPVGELADLRALTDLIRWMNAQPRKPGEQRTAWRHENAREQLELLGLKFLQPNGKGGKLYFRLSALEDVAPLLAAQFRASEPEPDATQPA